MCFADAVYNRFSDRFVGRVETIQFVSLGVVKVPCDQITITLG